MIEAGTRRFREAPERRRFYSFNQSDDETLRLLWKPDVQRAATAIVAGAVGIDGNGGAGRCAAIVLSHARGHLSADGRKHDKRQAVN